MATIIAPRRIGTWEWVPVATWCNERICRIEGGLSHYTVIIPAVLSLSTVAWCGSRSYTGSTFKWRVLHRILQFFQLSSFIGHCRQRVCTWLLIILCLSSAYSRIFPTLNLVSCKFTSWSMFSLRVLSLRHGLFSCHVNVTIVQSQDRVFSGVGSSETM